MLTVILMVILLAGFGMFADSRIRSCILERDCRHTHDYEHTHTATDDYLYKREYDDTHMEDEADDAVSDSDID